MKVSFNRRFRGKQLDFLRALAAQVTSGTFYIPEYPSLYMQATLEVWSKVIQLKEQANDYVVDFMILEDGGPSN